MYFNHDTRRKTKKPDLNSPALIFLSLKDYSFTNLRLYDLPDLSVMTK